jgi:hypothetical protein
MATESYVVYTTADEDGSGYGSEVDFETTTDDGFNDGFRIWKDRYDGAKLKLYVKIGSGDTLKLFGKFRAADDWIEVASYTTSAIVEEQPLPIWIIQRTAGSSNDSEVVWTV